jgi:alpha-tubulin suppressor-like RCC1 family protein
VSVGTDHTCGLRVNGAAFCWGSNRSYQLGVAHADTSCGGSTAYDCALTPQAVQPGVTFASISAGAKHTCAITASHEAYCWGANDLGQVGDFAVTSPTLVRVPGSLGWAQISAGFSHTCAVRTDGVLFCWGSNDRGQLGIGTLTASSGMSRVPIGVPIASVSAGQGRTCARSTLGSVYCWGATWTSQSGGLEMSRSQTTPLLVPSSPAMAWVSVGSFTTCGSDAAGFGYCWEGNPRGQMGNGTQNGSTVPTRVAADLEFVQISAGIVQSCGVTTSGAGYCWGDDSFGQLGVSPSVLVERCGGQSLPCSTVPTAVFGAQKFTEISAGFGSHVCGVTVKGNLYCWGLGLSGQRGDGTEAYATSTPIQALEPGAKP